jgi:hypothetical protein
MPKYNVSKNCQPDFYNEKPSVYGGQLEALVIFFVTSPTILGLAAYAIFDQPCLNEKHP